MPTVLAPSVSLPFFSQFVVVLFKQEDIPKFFNQRLTSSFINIEFMPFFHIYRRCCSLVISIIIESVPK